MENDVICIVDSGYLPEQALLAGMNIVGEISIVATEEKGITVQEKAYDNIGHGTAILDIISRYSGVDSYYIIKIFSEELTCDEEVLLYALTYILKNVPCKYVNISCGLSFLKLRKEFEDICSKITQRGTVLISAFDNMGAVSYPAALDTVIGVDADPVCKKHGDMVFVENSIVNVFAYGGVQRVKWTMPSYMFVSGTSYACAHVTAIISKHSCADIEEALDLIKKQSMQTVCFEEERITKNGQLQFKIKQAILFPYNKEMHSLINNMDMLSFQIGEIFDEPKLGNVGRVVQGIKIKSWKDINWEGTFDTVIIGHTRTLSEIVQKDLLQYLLENCKKYHKNVYSFDALEKYSELIKGANVFWPVLPECPNSNFDKLYAISAPVLGVFGTSSSQGKYTLQLKLRKMFLEEKYVVGQLGTEPTAALFEMDEMFHFGYDANVHLEHYNFIKMVNSSLNRIQKKLPDIILAGSQSNTIPYGITNLRYIPSAQIDFLLGLNPDRVILCINPYDELEYIRRTINMIEALVDCKVIAFVLYPMNYKNESIFGMNKYKITILEAETLKMKLMDNFQIPCYVLGEEAEMKELFITILDAFS